MTILDEEAVLRPLARRPRGVPALLATLAMVVISPTLLLTGIFRDEGATLYSAHLGLSDLFAQARVQDVIYVPYYLVMHVWLLPTDSLLWARLPSLLGFGAAVYLVTRTAQLWLGSLSWALVAGVVTALDPLLTEQASNARSYALSAAAAALAGYGLARMDRGVAAGPALYIIGATAAVLLHEFAGLGPLAALLVVGVARRWGARRVLSLAAIPVAPLLLLAALSSQQRGQLSFLHAPTVRDGIGVLSAPMGLSPVSGLAQLLLVVLLGCVVAARVTDVRVAACAAWLAVPGLLLLLGSLVTPIYLLRYVVTASTPALGLFVAAALQAAFARGPRSPRRLLAAALVAMLLLLNAAYVAHRFVAPFDHGNSDAAKACGRSASVALPTHMARTTLASIFRDLAA